MADVRTKGAASAHDPNVCVVVIAFERNDDVFVENVGSTGVDTIGVVIISSPITDEDGEENVVSPEDEDTFALVVALGGMSIVCVSLPKIKRKRFFCGVK